MIALMLAWFESRVTAYSHTARHDEPNIAVGSFYMVAAYILNGSTVEIRVSTDNGYTWDYVRSIAWGNCTRVADPVVDEDPTVPDRFYLTALADCGDADSVIFCTNDGPPDAYSSWRCEVIEDYAYENKDHPWVVAVGSYRVFVVYSLRNTQRLLVMETNDGGTTWLRNTEITYSSEDLLSPYAYYNGNSLYIAAESYNDTKDTIYIRVWKYENLISWQRLPSSATSFQFRTDDLAYRYCRYYNTTMRKGLNGITSSVDGTVAVVYLLTDNRYDIYDTCRVYVATTADDGNTWADIGISRLYGYEQYTPTIASSPWGRIWAIWQECDLYFEICSTKMSTTRSYSAPSWSFPYSISSHTYKLWTFEASHHYNDAEWEDYHGYLHVVWGNDSSATGGWDVWYARNDWQSEEVHEREADTSTPPYAVLRDGVLLRDMGEVYSASGRLVFRGEGRVSLPAGVYFVKVGGRVFRIVVR